MRPKLKIEFMLAIIYTMKQNSNEISCANSAVLSSLVTMGKYDKFGFNSPNNFLTRPWSVCLCLSTTDWSTELQLQADHASKGGKILLNGRDWTNQGADKIFKKARQFLDRTGDEKYCSFDPDDNDLDLIPIAWMITGSSGDDPCEDDSYESSFQGEINTETELKNLICAFLDDAKSQVKPFSEDHVSSMMSKKGPNEPMTFDDRTRIEIPIDEISIAPIHNPDGSSTGKWFKTTLVERCWGVFSGDRVIWLASSLQNAACLS